MHHHDTMYKYFDQVVEAVIYFGNHTTESPDTRKQSPGLYSLMQGGAICLARAVFLWCTDDLAEKDVIDIFSDALHRINPTSPHVLSLYLIGISAGDWKTYDSGLDRILNIILPRQKDSLQTLRNGLEYLLEYLTNSHTAQSEDTKQLGSDIVKVVCDAASLKYYLLVSADDGEDDLLFDSLRKIESVEEEAVLAKLTAGVSTCDSISGLFFKSISSVQIFRKCSDKSAFIFKRMERVAMEAESMHLLLQAGRHGDALKLKLFLDFKLMKVRVFLAEHLMISSSWVEEKVDALDQELQLLFKYLSFIWSCNEHYVEQILKDIKMMAEEDTPSYYLPQFHYSPEHTINQISVFLSTLYLQVSIMNSKIQDIAFPLRGLLTYQGSAFVDVFLEKRRGVIEPRALYGTGEYLLKHDIGAVQKELYTWRSFPLMMEVGEKKRTDPQLISIWKRITRAAFEADYIVDCILMNYYCGWEHIFSLSVVIDEMKVLNSELVNFVQMKDESGDHIHVAVQKVIMTPYTRASQAGEATVSLEDQENVILEKITRGKRREVVTISGMAGIGKTTLARRVYDHPRIKNHFHRLAWCCVSQVYRKRDLLLKLLSDVTQSSTDDMEKKDGDELLDVLYKGLKRNRYLVVMDDVWSNEAWDELGIAFSDDLNGSRILLTTRNEEVGRNIEPNAAPHNLRFLSEDESWKLLREKVFQKGECPKDLVKVGVEIAKGCKGLPMAIIAIAGLLKTPEMNVELWENIERELNSHIFGSPEVHCMHILELSYNHLPDTLKPCFLYFAAFGEDYEVPVHKLIQLWIAEGFIGKVHDQETLLLEDVAESYLTNLIGRSLVMVVKRGSSGKVKACKVHDMVYNLCLRKAEEENFLHCTNGYEELFPTSKKELDYGVNSKLPPISASYCQHRLSICCKRKHFAMMKLSVPFVRTLLYFPTNDSYPRCPYKSITYNLGREEYFLSILDIEGINMGDHFLFTGYPLRYLAISTDMKVISSHIQLFQNLETFIVKGLMGMVELPDTLWTMSKLRHLHVTTEASFRLLDGSLESSSQLNNMVSLSCPALAHGDNSVDLMRLFPQLRKLSCTFSEPAQHSEENIRFPVLDFLIKLESLKVIYYGNLSRHCQLKGVKFPVNLKKLSLSDFIFTWDDFSAIGMLPNLNILKLAAISFDTPIWEMKEDEFQELEYLKLDSLKVVEWKAENEHLPNLQQLVLRSCIRLMEVPSTFGDIDTLQMVELKWCSTSAEKSVMTIFEQQLDYGNSGFKAVVNGLNYSHAQSFNSSSDDQITGEMLTSQQEIEHLAKALLAEQEAAEILKKENEALKQKLKDQEEYGNDESMAFVNVLSHSNVRGEVPTLQQESERLAKTALTAEQEALKKMQKEIEVLQQNKGSGEE